METTNNGNTRPAFLGKGWGFPVTFLKKPCRVRMVSDLDDIAESLTILFTTRPGERILRADYGCGLDDLIHEPVNLSLTTYIKDIITKSVLFYEPRIELTRTDILTEDALEGRVKILLEGIVRASNTRFNYVFDYYKKEATITTQ